VVFCYEYLILHYLTHIWIADRQWDRKVYWISGIYSSLLEGEEMINIVRASLLVYTIANMHLNK
jgi:hypothetical protein